MDSGFIVINKPAGPTSHNIVDRMRKITGIKKIGHAGTLDPFAEGVLILAVGRGATKQIDRLVKTKKKYIADIRLGAVTDTYDRTGQIVEEKETAPPSKEEVKKVLNGFQGEQEQLPPMYSAKKVKGKKLYELARQGKEVERKTVTINIYSIELLKYEFPDLRIKVQCSSGTYLRTLAYDIGRELDCGAYLQELQRTAVGGYKLKSAINIEKITSDNWTKYLINR